MNHKFILHLSILLFGSVHILSAQAAGPSPSSTFPTQITSANGGGCIDAPLPQPANAEGGEVWFLQQFPCNGGANQHWSFQTTSSGTFVIHSTFNAGFCLDLPNAATEPNTRVQLFPCHGGPDQQWRLTQSDGDTAEISPELAPDMVLDVANGIARDRAVIQLFPRQGTANQRWRFPVDGLPQGLTGGIAYVNHDCGPNAAAFLAAGIAAIGLIACVPPLSESVGAWAVSCAQVIQGTSGIIAAGPGAFRSCGAPKVFRSGAVLAIGESLPVASLLLDSDSSFSVHAAPGWLTMSDGDRGEDRNFGFYHQELSAPSSSVSDTSVSDRFALPKGTACGFHHTRNTPYSVMQRFNLGPASSCMGHDPAQRDCPAGWRARNHFDMSSGGDGACGDLNDQTHCDYFVWCEYQDPNGLCDAAPNCLPNAHRRGFGLSVSSDTDAPGAATGVFAQNPPANNGPCPVGWIRTNAFDDGRDRGQGLSWCHPLPDDLPQGLTAGMAYRWQQGAGTEVWTGGVALGIQTPQAGDGFIIRSDGDAGAGAEYGFWHQELGAGGVIDPALSDRLKLMKGAACGFHHTRNTPGRSCMGHDPAQRDCPNGWLARNHFDMSSGNDGACGDLNDQEHCDYFVWCEYLDNNSVCEGDAATDCGYWAKFYGYTMGIASNTDRNGTSVALGLTCPPGWSPRTGYFDLGRSSGQGLSWCMP
jgi:hypothetical protein